MFEAVFLFAASSEDGKTNMRTIEVRQSDCPSVWHIVPGRDRLGRTRAVRFDLGRRIDLGGGNGRLGMIGVRTRTRTRRAWHDQGRKAVGQRTTHTARTTIARIAFIARSNRAGFTDSAQFVNTFLQIAPCSHKSSLNMGRSAIIFRIFHRNRLQVHSLRQGRLSIHSASRATLRLTSGRLSRYFGLHYARYSPKRRCVKTKKPGD